MNRSKNIKAIILFFFYFITNIFYLNTCYGNQKPIETMAGKPKTSLYIPLSLRIKLSMNNYNNYSYYLRKFPYPYESMVAICSDIDDSTPEEFSSYHRFLNTKDSTPYGKGLGLDIGDSMWMFMGNNHTNKSDYQGDPISHVLTYFSGTDDTKKHYANLLNYYCKVGWIDSMHTIGDFSVTSKKATLCTRNLAIKAWKEINKNGLKFSVWINHGSATNQQNFGGSYERDMSYQCGDNQKSKFYNSDLDIKNGIKFVWNSVCQSQFGYSCPIFKLKLRDGRKVWGFYRYTHDWINHKVSWTWNPKNLYKQITAYRLNTLVKKNQYSIIAQHLGGYNVKRPFNNPSVKALRLLASYQDKGKTLVARTSRLLNYCVTQKYLKFNRVKINGVTWFNIISIKDPLFGEKKPTLDDLRGITFYTSYPKNTHVLLNMCPIKDSMIQRNAPDSTGISSVSIKWFSRDYTDYTKKALAYYALDKENFKDDINNLIAKKVINKTKPNNKINPTNKNKSSNSTTQNYPTIDKNKEEQIDKQYPDPFQEVSIY